MKLLINNLNIHYKEAGIPGKPIMLFLHNGGSSLDIWDDLFPLLKQSYHLFALDLINFGDSDKIDHDCDLDFHTETVYQFLVKKKLPSVYIVACCIGANIAMNLAAKRTNIVKKLFLMNLCPGEEIFPSPFARKIRSLIASSSFLRFIMLKTLPYLSAMAMSNTKILPQILFHQKENMKSHHVFARLRTFYQSAAHTRGRLNLLFNLSSFNMPPLIKAHPKEIKIKLLWGKENEIVPLEYGRKVTTLMRPDEFEIIDNAGHLLMLEHPKNISGMIKDFC